MVKKSFSKKNSFKKALLFAGVFVLNYCLFDDVHAQQKLYANEFNLTEVTLLAVPFTHARHLPLKPILVYHVVRLLAPYTTVAGFPPMVSIYKTWVSIDAHVVAHPRPSMAS